MTAPVVLLLIMHIWMGWLLRRYKLTGDRKHLTSLALVVMAGAFFTGATFAWQAVIYPERLEWAMLTVLAAAIGGGALSAYASGPGKRGSSIFSALVYLGFSVFVVVSFPVHGMHRPLRLAHGERECAKVVPGSSKGEIANLKKPEREALAARLGEALASPDDFVRLGALQKLSYMPEEAGPAVPAMTPLIAAIKDYDEVSRELMRLLTMMGPAAAGAVPAIEAKIADLGSYHNYDLEKVLTAVKPVPTAGTPAE